MGHILSHQFAIETTVDLKRLLGVISVTDRADVYSKFQRLTDARTKDTLLRPYTGTFFPVAMQGDDRRSDGRERLADEKPHDSGRSDHLLQEGKATRLTYEVKLKEGDG